ncbi:MAG: aconitase X catalytic domain-containing protein [Acidilobaceae archaeon]
MHLTREEERILRGEEGWARAKALEVIVRVGEALGAERLVEIKHAHVSGVSYENIGEEGLKFIEDLAESGARFKVPASVNPVSFDVDEGGLPGLWQASRVEAEKQARILKALSSMGARLTLTCTPYYETALRDLALRVGDSVAWGESSAVAYANSVLGLRTNREGGPIALLAGIAGRTYYYGMHVEEERRSRVAYEIDWVVEDEAEAGVLGSIIAERHEDSRPPMLRGRVSGEGALRELLASLGVAGDIPMIYLPGVSPEPEPQALERVERVSRREVEEKLEELSPPDSVDVVYLGCPHLSLGELDRLARELEERGGARARVILTASPETYNLARARGLIDKLERYGARIARGTCLVVSPFWKLGLSVATNSFKAYFYLKRRGVRAYLARTRDLLSLVVSK